MTLSLPARCTHCGHQWQPRPGILISDASNETFTNCWIDCERCGAPAQFLDGTFDEVNGALRMRSGPQWSWDLVEQLGLAVRQILDEDPEDPVAAAEERLPGGLGELVAEAVREGLAAQAKPDSLRRRRRLGKAVLYGLIAVVGFDYQGAADNVTWVGEQVRDLLAYVAEHGDVPPAPE